MDSAINLLNNWGLVDSAIQCLNNRSIVNGWCAKAKKDFKTPYYFHKGIFPQIKNPNEEVN